MKTKLIALLVLCASALLAHGTASKITGPNKGRILTQLEPHAEFFITADGRVRLTFINDEGNPIASPSGFSATLITGERSAPVTLTFAAEGNTLLSTARLPEGINLPAILRAKPTADSEIITIRFQLNQAICGECSRPEYACTCAH